jgi:glucosamine-6-phosphate deaminase
MGAGGLSVPYVPQVLGLATGSTPVPLYKELIRLHKEEGLDFSKVITFNLDECMAVFLCHLEFLTKPTDLGLPPNHEQSYHRFMWDTLFSRTAVLRLAHLMSPRYQHQSRERSYSAGMQ